MLQAFYRILGVSQRMSQHSFVEMLQDASSKKDYLGTKRSLVSQQSLNTANENVFHDNTISVI